MSDRPWHSIGQWAPIVGTGLAAIGSLYLDVEEVAPIDSKDKSDHPPKDHMGVPLESLPRPATPADVHLRPQCSKDELLPTSSRPQNQTPDGGHRRKVRRVFTALGDFIGTAPYKTFADPGFKRSTGYWPEIPAEWIRNKALPQIKVQWDTDENGSSVYHEQRSRAASVARSHSSGHSIEGSSKMQRAASVPLLQLPRSLSSIQPDSPRRQSDPQKHVAPACSAAIKDTLQVRRSALEVKFGESSKANTVNLPPSSPLPF